MTSPVQRNGTWWQQNEQGKWHRWDAAASAWVEVAAPPPPPPPPGPSPRPSIVAPPAPSRPDILGTPASAGPSRRWLVTSVALVIVAAAAGGYLFLRPSNDAAAGSTPASASRETPSPSRPARKVGVATRIERLCRATEARSKGLMPPKNEAEMNELLAITKTFSVEVRKLDPPQRFDPLVEHFDRGVALLERGFQTATEMDPVIERMKAAQAEGDRATFSALMAQARQLGARSAELLGAGGRSLQRASRVGRSLGIDC